MVVSVESLSSVNSPIHPTARVLPSDLHSRRGVWCAYPHHPRPARKTPGKNVSWSIITLTLTCIGIFYPRALAENALQLTICPRSLETQQGGFISALYNEGGLEEFTPTLGCLVCLPEYIRRTPSRDAYLTPIPRGRFHLRTLALVCFGISTLFRLGLRALLSPAIN